MLHKQNTQTSIKLAIFIRVINFYFKKIIVCYKKIGYNINVMRQTACLVVNPIKVNSFAYLFNCTTVGRTSDFRCGALLFMVIHVIYKYKNK